MPTIVVLDTHQACSKGVRGLVNTTVFDLLKQGCRFFLESLVQQSQTELVSLVGRDGQILGGFTADYEALLNILAEVRPESQTQQPTTNWNATLQSCISQPSKCWPGADANSLPTNILMFVYSSTTEYDLEIDLLPNRIVLHCISICDSRSQNLSNGLSHACTDTGGIFRTVFLEDDGWIHLKSSVTDIVSIFYKRYEGVLAAGHLVALIGLHPNPYTSMWPALATQHGLSYELPKVLSIVGFISIRNMPNPLALCRFAITASPLHQPSPLLAMLAESIKQRRCFAVVLLEKPDWYGILCSHSDYRFMQGRNDKNEEADTIAERSGLILSILPRGYCQEWGNTIGMVDTAGTQYLNYNTQTTTPTMRSVPSYAIGVRSTKVQTGITEDQVNKYLSKLLGLVKSVPQSCNKLYKHCEKIRCLAKRFNLPQLVETSVDIMSKELQGRDPSTIEYLTLAELMILIQQNDPIVLRDLDEIRPDPTSSKQFFVVPDYLKKVYASD